MPDVDIFAKAQSESRSTSTFARSPLRPLVKGRASFCFVSRTSELPLYFSGFGSILETSKLALENGRVIVVEDSRHRIRQLPIGKADRGE